MTPSELEAFVYSSDAVCTVALADIVAQRMHALQRIERLLRKYPLTVKDETDRDNVLFYITQFESKSLKKLLRSLSSSGDYNHLTKIELQKIARKLRVPRWSRRTKRELIEGIIEFKGDHYG